MPESVGSWDVKPVTVRVKVNPDVLRWAVDRTGMPLHELIQRAGFHRLEEWMEGTQCPTLKQARALADLACIPFGYLLLDAPTDDQPPLPDFRSVGAKG